MQKKQYIAPLMREITLSPYTMLLQGSDTTAIKTDGEEFDDEKDFNFAARKKRSAWDDDMDDAEAR
ncbi:MAG: hypothetical protein IJ841_08245 [Prevotella sp.]|nr:hypothetical protein [Prevotella sp.]